MSFIVKTNIDPKDFINIRNNLNWNSLPYDLVKKKFGKEFLEKINIKRIPNKKVKLKQII